MDESTSDIILTSDEQDAVDHFLLSNDIEDNYENRQLAIYCLLSRSLSLKASLELFNAHREFLTQENLTDIDPLSDEHLRTDIVSGKFTILNDDEFTGARVAQFFVRLHRPSTTSHATVLKNVLFQLKATLIKEVAIRNGLIIIYDMTRAKYSNFDMDLSVKFFNMLKYKYPIKLRSLIILSNSLWARASLKLLRVFLSENFKDVHVVEPKEGTELAHLANAPEVDHMKSHYSWIKKCLIRLNYVDSNDYKTLNEFIFDAPKINGTNDDSTSSLNGSECYLTNTLPNGKKFNKKYSKNGSFSESSMSINRSPARHLVYNLGRRVHNTTANVVRKCSFTSSLIHNGSSKRSSSLLSKGTTLSAGSLVMNSDNGDHQTNGNSVNNEDDEKTIAIHDEDVLFESNCKSRNLTGGSLRVSPSKLNNIFTTTPSHSNGPTEVCSLGRAEVRVCRSNRKSRVIPIVDSNGHDYSSSTADKIVQELADATSVLANEFNLEIKNAPLAAQEMIDGDHQHSNKQKPPKTSKISGQQDKSKLKTPRASRGNSISGNKENKINHLLPSMSCTKSLRLPAKELILGIKGQGSEKSKSMIIPEERIINNCTYCLESEVTSNNDNKDINKCYSCETKTPLSQQNSSDPPQWSLNRPIGESVHQHPHLNMTENKLINSVSPFHTICKIDCLPVGDEDLINLQNETMTTTSLPLNNTEDRSDFEDSEDDESHLYHAQEQTQLIYNKRIVVNSWLNIKNFLEHINRHGYVGLVDEYNCICRISTQDNLENFKSRMNRPKNRYNDVICYDYNRVLIRSKPDVRLKPLSAQNLADDNIDEESQTKEEASLNSSNPSCHDSYMNNNYESFNNSQNYIHANWVDSYRQKNAFICTQGPLNNTVGDFWRLVWDYNVPVIVMITKTNESNRAKCYQYWPTNGSATFPDIDSSFPFGQGQSSGDEEDEFGQNGSGGYDERSLGRFKITKVHCVNTENYSNSLLRIQFSSTGEERNVHHYAFNAWPDHGVPHDTSYLLELLSSVNTTYMDHLRRHHGYTSVYDQEIPPPPIVVHCSAGIGRTGTFISLDVCTKALHDGLEMQKADPGINVKLNIPLTVARIRSQRAGCVQVPAQYIFCYRALLSYMKQLNLITPRDFDIANASLLNEEANSNTWAYPSCPQKIKSHLAMMASSKISSILQQQQQQPGHFEVNCNTIFPSNGTTTTSLINNNNNYNGNYPEEVNKQQRINTAAVYPKKMTSDNIINNNNFQKQDLSCQIHQMTSKQTDQGKSTKSTGDDENNASDYENDYRKDEDCCPQMMSTNRGHNNPLSLSDYETEDEPFPDDMTGTMESILS